MTTRARVSRNAFNAGELSERMMGRTDTAAFAAGCEEMIGFMPLLQGPAVAMPGTMFAAAAAGPCRLIPFEYDVDRSYVIEASANKFRFYSGNGRIETSPGVPFEIATPWTYAQVLELDWQQSLDVLYLVHPAKPPMELRRLTSTTFELVEIDLQNGPFMDGNADVALTVSGSDDTGLIVLQAYRDATPEEGFFTSEDDGRLFQLEAADYASIPAWEVGITVEADDVRTSDGKVYTALDSGRTGTVQPIHTEGVAYDGMASGEDVNENAAGGVRWEYKNDRFGLVRLGIAAGDGASIAATVLRRIPTGLTVSTWRWAFGAFSDRSGWPEAVAIWNERLVFGWRDRLFASAVGGYGGGAADFAERDDAGDFQRDLSFIYRLQNPNRVRWLEADVNLRVGTAKAEHVVEQLVIQSGAPAPTVIRVETPTRRGSKKAKPALAHGRLLFLQREGRKLIDFEADSAPDGEPDMTRFAEHLGDRGFRDLTWVQEPEHQLWSAMGDGTLAMMCYSPTQRVNGWCRRQLGGGMLARSTAASSDFSGTRDQLWIAAQLGSAWLILRQMPLRRSGEAVAASFYVDAGLSYIGSPISSGAGLDHLVGRTCTVLADGKPHPDIVIGSGGSWAIEAAAGVIHIGLAYPAEIKLLPPELSGGRGTAQGQIKKIPRVLLRLRETGGIEIAVQGLAAQHVETRPWSVPLDAATPLYSGDFLLDTGGDFDREGRVSIRRTQPLPAMVLAMIAECEVAE